MNEDRKELVVFCLSQRLEDCSGENFKPISPCRHGPKGEFDTLLAAFPEDLTNDGRSKTPHGGEDDLFRALRCHN
jgi:hypothetical protein